MRAITGLKGAERNTPHDGLIIEISRKTGERVYVIHVDAETEIKVFRPGDLHLTHHRITVGELHAVDINGGL